MRIARLPAVEDERLIYWQHVTNITYFAEGTRRFLIVTYKNGATKNVEIHQARDLWYDVEQHKGCAAPCYYRHETDTAPQKCTDCKLAEALEGVDCPVRPAPLPPRRLPRADVRNTLIVLLALLSVTALLGWGMTLSSPPLPEKVSPGASKRVGDTGKSTGVGER